MTDGPDRLVGLPQIAQYAGLSRDGLHSCYSAGHMPTPDAIGNYSHPLWLLSRIWPWLEEYAHGKRGGA